MYRDGLRVPAESSRAACHTPASRMGRDNARDLNARVISAPELSSCVQVATPNLTATSQTVTDGGGFGTVRHRGKGHDCSSPAAASFVFLAPMLTRNLLALVRPAGLLLLAAGATVD